MGQPNLFLVGYIAYIILNSVIFIIDVLMGHGGSGEIFEKFWLLILATCGIIIFIATTKYLFKILVKVNKIILLILSLAATFLQMVALYFIFFFLAMFILASILAKNGYYVTMP